MGQHAPLELRSRENVRTAEGSGHGEMMQVSAFANSGYELERRDMSRTPKCSILLFAALPNSLLGY